MLQTAERLRFLLEAVHQLGVYKSRFDDFESMVSSCLEARIGNRITDR